MSVKEVKNTADSVRQRLLNKAHEQQKPFNELLQHFAMERFLYRLSKSEYGEKFILKGGVMLYVCDAPAARSTRDIDLLGRTSNNSATITKQIKSICAIKVIDDGLVFNADSIKSEAITEAADYSGIRATFIAQLGTAKITMQLDIGFGDIVYPAPETITVPTILDFPAPHLKGYSRESIIAEKLQALVFLGEINSRMKDFYDIHLLSKLYAFNGEQLQTAIQQTFDKRITVIPEEVTAFGVSFITAKSMQWNAFLKNLGKDKPRQDFSECIEELKLFIMPVLTAIRTNQTLSGNWNPQDYKWH